MLLSTLTLLLLTSTIHSWTLGRPGNGPYSKKKSSAKSISQSNRLTARQIDHSDTCDLDRSTCTAQCQIRVPSPDKLPKQISTAEDMTLTQMEVAYLTWRPSFDRSVPNHFSLERRVNKRRCMTVGVPFRSPNRSNPSIYDYILFEDEAPEGDPKFNEIPILTQHLLYSWLFKVQLAPWKLHKGTQDGGPACVAGKPDLRDFASALFRPKENPRLMEVINQIIWDSEFVSCVDAEISEVVKQVLDDGLASAETDLGSISNRGLMGTFQYLLEKEKDFINQATRIRSLINDVVRSGQQAIVQSPDPGGLWSQFCISRYSIAKNEIRTAIETRGRQSAEQRRMQDESLGVKRFRPDSMSIDRGFILQTPVNTTQIQHALVQRSQQQQQPHSDAAQETSTTLNHLDTFLEPSEDLNSTTDGGQRGHHDDLGDTLRVYLMQLRNDPSVQLS